MGAVVLESVVGVFKAAAVGAVSVVVPLPQAPSSASDSKPMLMAERKLLVVIGPTIVAPGISSKCVNKLRNPQTEPSALTLRL